MPCVKVTTYNLGRVSSPCSALEFHRDSVAYEQAHPVLVLPSIVPLILHSPPHQRVLAYCSSFFVRLEILFQSYLRP